MVQIRKVSIFNIFIFLLIVFLFACNNKKNERNNISVINATITEAQVNHVVEKREGCRIPVIYFILNIENISSETQNLNFTYFRDYCEREIETTNIYWLVNENKIPLAVSPNDSIITVQPHGIKQVELRGMFPLRGMRLRDINSFYSSWFGSPFTINYQNNKTESVFKKADDFKVDLFLDDTLITPKDSIKYNLSLGGPSSSVDTLKVDLPTIEPEL